MLKRIVTMIAVGCVLGANGDILDKTVQIQKTLDTILSKNGIAIAGEFKSQYFGADIEGKGSDTTKRTHESNEFTSVDFDIKARPNDNIAGRVIFRMHQNWQNFYSDISNPIFTRWLSIDGHARDMFRFSVGDYRARYSPLTLYTPEIDIMYEPYIFARERQIAMDEVFVGNNDRVLQGVSFNFDAEIAPIFKEFHYSLTSARLREADVGYKSGSTMAVAKIEVAFPMSTYYVGNNFDVSFLKGINLGGSFLTIFDHKGSYRQQNIIDTIAADTLAQFTNIFSVRPQVDVAKFLDNDALTLKIGVESATSLDDSTRFDTASGFTSTTITGNALRAGLDAGYKVGEQLTVGLNAAFLSNDDHFRNPLAQSPSFVPSRIMNLENDDTLMLGQYTTFDALYHSVFKFAPQAKSGRWLKAPFMKNSYSRTIYNQQELSALYGNSGLDPSIELVMPLGPATPNRQGISTNLNGTFLKGAIEVKGLLSMLSEKDLDTVIRTSDSAKFEIPATAFSQMGGGLKVDVSKFIPTFLRNPLELSGSVVISSAVNDGFADTVAITPPKWEITSSFVNAGLYWKFFKRAALTGGLQLINVDAKIDTAKCVQDQMHWAAGLEWKVSQGADVVVSYGQIGVVNDKTNPRLLRSRWAVPIAKDFTQDLVDVSLRVKF
jgi:hypothetical protein